MRGKSALFRLVVRNGFAHFVRKVFARRKLLPGKFWVYAPLGMAIRAPDGANNNIHAISQWYCPSIMVILTCIEIDTDIHRVKQIFWSGHTLPLSWSCDVILSYLHKMTSCCNVTLAVIYAINSEDIFGWKSCPWRNDHKYQVLSMKDNGFRMLIDCRSNHLELWSRVDYFVQRLHSCTGNYTLAAWMKTTRGYFETHCVVITFQARTSSPWRFVIKVLK